MPRAPVEARIRQKRSGSLATPIVSPGSSPNSASNGHIWPGCRSGGALAIELARRHPAAARTFILVSAYAGWAGSLPADVAQQRLRQALVLAELSPEEFVDALLPTMFSEGTSQ